MMAANKAAHFSAMDLGVMLLKKICSGQTLQPENIHEHDFSWQ